MASNTVLEQEPCSSSSRRLPARMHRKNIHKSVCLDACTLFQDGQSLGVASFIPHTVDCQNLLNPRSLLVMIQVEKAVQAMDPTSDGLPHAEGSGSHKAEALQLNNMSMPTTPSADHCDASKEQQKRQDPLDDKMDELGKKLAALTAETSPPRSSSESFRTAQEQISPVQPSEKALGKRKEEVSPRKPSPVLLPQRGSRRQSSTTPQTSSRPTTSLRPSIKRSSTAPTSQFPSASSSRRAQTSTRPSTASSSANRATTGLNVQSASTPSTRRSSFLLTQPATTQANLPTRRHRRSNAISPSTTTQINLPTRRHRRSNAIFPSITIHPNGRQALQSVRAFSDLQTATWAGMRAEQQQQRLLFPTSSTSTLPRADNTTTAPATNYNNDPAAAETASPAYENHVPASNIDWTSPSTRRREYEKIDKARKGVRGFLRRITPSCLRGNGGRMGFHGEDGDGMGSDAGGSVRRFRMEVEDEEGGVVKGRWWKIWGKKGKGTGSD